MRRDVQLVTVKAVVDPPAQRILETAQDAHGDCIGILLLEPGVAHARGAGSSSERIDRLAVGFVPAVERRITAVLAGVVVDDLDARTTGSWQQPLARQGHTGPQRLAVYLHLRVLGQDGEVTSECLLSARLCHLPRLPGCLLATAFRHGSSSCARRVGSVRCRVDHAFWSPLVAARSTPFALAQSCRLGGLYAESLRYLANTLPSMVSLIEVDQPCFTWRLAAPIWRW